MSSGRGDIRQDVDKMLDQRGGRSFGYWCRRSYQRGYDVQIIVIKIFVLR